MYWKKSWITKNFRASTGQIVRSSSDSSVTNLEDSMYTLQIERSSSVTKLHPTGGDTWNLNPTRQMKDQGEWMPRISYGSRSGSEAQNSCGRRRIIGLDRACMKIRSRRVPRKLRRSLPKEHYSIWRIRKHAEQIWKILQLARVKTCSCALYGIQTASKDEH